MYEKQEWIDRIVDEDGNVIVEGSPFTAERMGHIEDGIEEAHNHTHSAADINDGILPLEFGGTGVSSIEALVDALKANGLTVEVPIVFGSYTGDCEVPSGDISTAFLQERTIELGFTPRCIIVSHSVWGVVQREHSTGSGATSYNCVMGGISVTGANNEYIQIVENGFKVANYKQGKNSVAALNTKDNIYMYIAFK